MTTAFGDTLVLGTSGRRYMGFSVSPLRELASGDVVAAKGPLSKAGGVPTVGAFELRARSVGN